MSMKTASNVLDKMDDQQLQDTLRSLSVLADPLTRKIMAKLASKHSPIAANNIPVEQLNASEPAIISRLCRLESYGFATTTKCVDDGMSYKVYSINETGRRMVEKSMEAESAQFL